MNFIASPEIVTAFALAGRLSFNPMTDSLVGADGKPFRLIHPRPRPKVRERLREGTCGVRAAASEWDNRVARVNPDSERLQLMEPWPEWDGHDFPDMPILIKTTAATTDISPAGRWLRYRGHLDKFSDNMFSVDTNAFTGEVGKTKNIFQRRKRPRDFQSLQRLPCARMDRVVIGDWNYGEGGGRGLPPSRRITEAVRPSLPAAFAHPRVQSEEAGAAHANLSRTGWLDGDPRGRSPQFDRAHRDGAFEAGGMPR